MTALNQMYPTNKSTD